MTGFHKTVGMQHRLLQVVICAVFACTTGGERVFAFPVSGAAWSEEQWIARCSDVRTTYNPQKPLSTVRLTLRPDDPRFVDFLFWVWGNKVTEHQVEQIGGTDWDGPRDGVIFHWAPGSRWERHTVIALQDAIHHVGGEHGWTDTMFKDFFAAFGPVRGVNIAARLSIDTPPTWRQFLAHVGGPESPYYRYVFHQESGVDPVRRTVSIVGGQGVAFEYSFDRYLHEIQEVLTDCRAYQFFQLYDVYGQGFASTRALAAEGHPAWHDGTHAATNGTGLRWVDVDGTEGRPAPSQREAPVGESERAWTNPDGVQGSLMPAAHDRAPSAVHWVSPDGASGETPSVEEHGVATASSEAGTAATVGGSRQQRN